MSPINTLGALALLTGCAASCAAQGADTARGWYAGAGLVVPAVRERGSDFRAATSATTIEHSTVTVPDLTLGYAFERLAVELGYRKLGVTRYHTADGLTEGDTHSNAIGLSAVMPFGGARSIALYSRLGVEAVRTVATFDRRDSAFPVRGGTVWQTRGLVGVGLAVTPDEAWTWRAESLWTPGTLGEAHRTGRIRQSTLALQVLRRF